MRPLLMSLALLAAPTAAMASSCELEFRIEITRGVGDLRPGDIIAGVADFTTMGEFRQEGGATAHLAQGTMVIDDRIVGPVWTLITTSDNPTAELVGIYAHDVTGFEYAGTVFDGPMALTLYGSSGSRAAPVPPTSQDEWDSLDLRRTFQLHAHGQDMLAGTVVELVADCR